MTTSAKNLIDKCLELDKAGTPGPWNHEQERYSAKNVIGVKPRYDQWIAHCLPEFNGDDNADLIAAYRDMAPRLAKALEVAVKVLDEYADIENWHSSEKYGEAPWSTCDQDAKDALTEIERICRE